MKSTVVRGMIAEGGLMKSSYFEFRTYIDHLKIKCFPINVMMNRAHWHSSLEMILCTKGYLSVAFNEKEYNLREADLITIDSGFSHEIYNGESGGQQLILEIDESLINRTDNYLFDFKTVGEENCLNKSNPDVESVISKLYDLAHSFGDMQLSYAGKKGSSVITRYHILSTAYSILETLQGYTVVNKNTITRYPSDTLKEFIDLIQSEYATIQSQEEVAKRLGLSISSLHRMLKSQMGVSFLTYLNSVRISAAEALLMDESTKIIDISEQCGFTNLSSFYRDFKKYSGRSPNQYRESRMSANFYMMNPSVLARNNYEQVSYDDIK